MVMAIMSSRLPYPLLKFRKWLLIFMTCFIVRLIYERNYLTSKTDQYTEISKMYRYKPIKHVLRCSMDLCFNWNFIHPQQPVLFCFQPTDDENAQFPESTRIKESNFYAKSCKIEHNASIRIISSYNSTYNCSNTLESPTCLYIVSDFSIIKKIWSSMAETVLPVQLMIASQVFPHNMFRRGYDIWLPLFKPFNITLNDKQIIHRKRNILVGFSCGTTMINSRYNGIQNKIMKSLISLQQNGSTVIQNLTGHSYLVAKVEFYPYEVNLMKCWGTEAPLMTTNTWYPCRSANKILDLSLYCLLIAEELSPFDSGWQAQLSTCLRSGSIPVIVGSPSSIHLSDNAAYSDPIWSELTLQVPIAKLDGLVDGLLSIPDAQVRKLQQSGKIFYKKYLTGDIITQLSMINAVISRRVNISSVIDRTIPTRLIKSIKNQVMYYTVDRGTVDSWNSTNSESLSQLEVSLANSQLNTLTGMYWKGKFEYDDQDKFTVVMLFYKRHRTAIETVRLLQNLPSIKSVIMVWNEIEGNIESLNLTEIHIPIYVVKMTSNSLNNRFLPFDLIETDAVLQLDDDTRIPNEDLELGFKVWRQQPTQIVGYPARSINWNRAEQRWIYVPVEKKAYSMILTGGAFIHRHYMVVYTWEMPFVIRRMVDEYRNCEDIAMNFLVSHINGKPAVKVGRIVHFYCKNCGPSLYTQPSHYEKRSECIGKLADLYGYIPLVTTEVRALAKT